MVVRAMLSSSLANPLLLFLSDMKFFLLFLLGLSLAGCKTYHEKFVKLDSTGATNYVFVVRYSTWFVRGSAGALSTSTQMEDLVRSVDLRAVSTQVDSQGIEAAGGAVGSVVGKAVSSAAGKP